MTKVTEEIKNINEAYKTKRYTSNSLLFRNSKRSQAIEDEEVGVG